MAADVYLICPVRNATDEDRRFADEYVAKLEGAGITVHYPPRDVDQADDGIGFALNAEHRRAMFACREVHVVWDPNSSGSRFDLGMAMMLQKHRDVPIVLARPVKKTPRRSYGNILMAAAEPSRLLAGKAGGQV